MNKSVKVKYRIKKKFIIIIFLIFIILFLRILLMINSYSYKLKKQGYTKDDIEIINNNLENSNKSLLLAFEYNKNILLIINDENFIEEKFSEYLKYYKNTNILYDSNIIQIINEKYYLSKNLDRYVKYYSNNKDESPRKIVEDINCNLDIKYYSTDYDVDLTKKTLVLVNKYYKLNKGYVPSDLVEIEKKYGNNRKASKELYDAFKEMYKDASKQKLYINITSAYRSYAYQNNLYNSYKKKDGASKVDTYSARSGYSEHQTGLAIDISSKSTPYTKFEDTKEYKWMIKNCYKYGFILRYPKDKEKQTGYMFESWHYRYVGKKVAKYIYENNITYDEYYEYFVK